MQRLNSDARPQGLWTIDKGQLNLSRTMGGLRIVWSILGGRIMRGWPFTGSASMPVQPAKCVAVRLCRLRADIFCDNANTVGLTPDDQQLTEEILRALIIVWNQQRPADFDIDEQQEGWPNYTGDPGQRQIRAHYEVTCGLTVLADPYLYKDITEVDGSAVVGAPP